LRPQGRFGGQAFRIVVLPGSLCVNFKRDGW
jgi:hypothetical protein